ncbi:GntR family transcriptional regulator [Hoeflea marina]|uniref:GntR family transcriptional regulator n=1 Tax=Hoeflea marina TaxID=274592 RepID=A0A317PYJ4_9HYPH|nr:GntR family transcriptional regulator [Hoeflea marina]PWW04580.1 GntR family transcriptional regulator [Hoeflea marina]
MAPRKPARSKTSPPESAARKRFDALYGKLRSRICLLDYPPGSRLSEEVLAAEFGVSRTPLRRVLGRLEAEGLLRSEHGVGTIVTDVDIEEMAQVYHLRMELAELIGKLSPVPPSPATLALFRHLRDQAHELIKAPDPRAFTRINGEFWDALLLLTDNEPLREISERLYYQTTRIWLKSIPHMDLADEVAIFARETADIQAAVALGDIRSVGLIRRAHISMSFLRLRRATG